MIKGIDHIAIAVSSIEKTAKLFEIYFGLSIEHKERLEKQSIRLAIINIGGVNIELIEPLTKDSSVANFIMKRGEGIHHIAFKVKKIEKVLNELRKKGVKILDREPRKGMRGKKIAFISPGNVAGTLIELCE
ncbi:MAG: methylmalonyl-CoA epimerase [Candidatus Cloacimonadota bacterium]|nr:MAG: methylmalonyl-CoA epimerase [Candidatus Cloacimonadota bacterium]